MKLIEKKSRQELARFERLLGFGVWKKLQIVWMDLRGLEETFDNLTKANGMQWFGHVWRRDNNGVSRRALNFEGVERKRHVGQR